jgi:hypothetical protein
VVWKQQVADVDRQGVEDEEKETRSHSGHEQPGQVAVGAEMHAGHFARHGHSEELRKIVWDSVQRSSVGRTRYARTLGARQMALRKSASSSLSGMQIPGVGHGFGNEGGS